MKNRYSRLRLDEEADTLMSIENGMFSGAGGFVFTQRTKSTRGCSSRTFRSRTLFKILLVFGIVVFVYALALLIMNINIARSVERPYNNEPLSKPELSPDGSLVYQIGVVTDLDKESKTEAESKTKWHSFFKRGNLIDKSASKVWIDWNSIPDKKLSSEIANGGRAMELSDLVVFDHRLITVDDRTGILYEVSESFEMIPWIILDDGPGNVTKPLKGEWMSVKDEHLYVGGLGKEWTDEEGNYINDHPMWVKRVDRFGRVEHLQWADRYKAVRASMGIQWPGYMVHEAVQWSPVHRKWFFLPRRVSHQSYDEAADESRGSNVLLAIEDDFELPAFVVRIGSLNAPSTRGFSAFQFVPGTEDQIIVALKSEERDGIPVATYITVFNIEGLILLPDQPLNGSYKFEGIAFV